MNLLPTFDAKMFNATADGVADDTAELQALFTAAKANNRRLIRLRGRFLISSNITLTSASHIEIDARGATFVDSQRITGGLFAFDDCDHINWIGGKFIGRDTQAELYTLTENNTPAWTALNADNRMFCFRFDDCDDYSIRNVQSQGKCAFLLTRRSTRWVAEEVRFDGVLDGTLDPWNNLSAPDDKSVILNTYAIVEGGGEHFKVRDMWANDCAGAFSCGEAANAHISRHFELLNINTQRAGNNPIYIGGAEFYTIQGGKHTAHAGTGAVVKAHGRCGKVLNVTGQDFHQGVELSGIGTTTSVDDPWGQEAHDLTLKDCTFRNILLCGLLIQSDKMYPRDVLVEGNSFINCGMVGTAGSGTNLYDSVPAADNRPSRLFTNGVRYTIRGNTWDSSASGGIEAMASVGGFLVIKTNTAYHGLGPECVIDVFDHPTAAFNARHRVTALSGTGGALEQWLTTSTPFAGPDDVGGGRWHIARPDCAVAMLALKGITATEGGQQVSHGHVIEKNKFIGCIQGVRARNIADSTFHDNRGVGFWGRASSTGIDGASLGASGEQPSSLLHFEDVSKLTITENRMMPQGMRVVYVRSGTVFSGCTVSGNVGFVDASAAAAPSGGYPSDISKCKFWWEAQFALSTNEFPQHTGGVLTSGDSVHGYGDATGASSVLADGSNVAMLIDRISGTRFWQTTDGRRPTYQTSEINGLPCIRFDGTDDILFARGQICFGTSGEIVLVAKHTTTTPSTQAMLGFASDYQVNTYLQFICRANNNTVRLAQRKADTEDQITTDASASNFPQNAWRIVSVRSDGATISFTNSNGAGGQSALTTGVSSGANSGDWLSDCESTNAPMDNLSIGGTRFSTGATNYFAGDIAAILIFDDVLTTGERDDVFEYLFSQYGSI